MKKKLLAAEIEVLTESVRALEKRVAELEAPKYQKPDITVDMKVVGWENFRSLDLMFTRLEIEQMASAAVKQAMKRHGLQ